MKPRMVKEARDFLTISHISGRPLQEILDGIANHE